MGSTLFFIVATVTAVFHVTFVYSGENEGYEIKSSVSEQFAKLQEENTDDKTVYGDWPAWRLTQEGVGVFKVLSTRFPQEFGSTGVNPLKSQPDAKPALDLDAATFVGFIGEGGNSGDTLMALINLRIQGFQTVAYCIRKAVGKAELIAKLLMFAETVMSKVDPPIKNTDELKADVKKRFENFEEKDLRNLIDNPDQYTLHINKELIDGDTMGRLQDGFNKLKQREIRGKLIEEQVHHLLKLAEDLGLHIKRQNPNEQFPMTDIDSFVEGKVYFQKFKNIMAVLDGIAGAGRAGSVILPKAKVALLIMNELKKSSRLMVAGNAGNPAYTQAVAVDMASFEENARFPPTVAVSKEIHDQLEIDQHFVVKPSATVVINGFRDVSKIPENMVDGVDFYQVVPHVIYKYLESIGKKPESFLGFTIKDCWVISRKGTAAVNPMQLYQSFPELDSYLRDIQVVKV